jgi:hypothetical protein
MLAAMEAARQHGEPIRTGALEIAPDDGLVLAGGRALTLSVREFGLLVAAPQLQYAPLPEAIEAKARVAGLQCDRKTLSAA